MCMDIVDGMMFAILWDSSGIRYHDSMARNGKQGQH